MHMSDALLSPAVGGAMFLAAAAVEGYCINRLNKSDLLSSKTVPMMGVAGAFVFSAQMINFAIPMTGSSGHLSGGLLLAALLGPYAGFMVLSVVLLIQALFFADGGLLALGANMINMGFFACFLAYPFIMKPMLRKGTSKTRIMLSSVLGGITALLLGAFAVSVETTMSGITELPFSAFAALMLFIHLPIGLVEGLITGLVLVFIANNEPQMLTEHSTAQPAKKPIVIALAVVAAITGVIISHFASGNPDGLEWSIENTAGAEITTTDALHLALDGIQQQTAILPDYSMTSLSGLVGSLIVVAFIALIAMLISAVKRRAKN